LRGWKTAVIYALQSMNGQKSPSRIRGAPGPQAVGRFCGSGISMLTKKRNALRTALREFLTAFIAWLTGLTPVENTKTSWAESVKSSAAVPDAFKSFFNPILAGGRAFPYSVLTPSFEGFIHPQTEKLICDLGREICVLEKSGNAFLSQCYPLEGILYVEWRTILLDSQIKIRGVAENGDPASSTLRFNSVTDHLLIPILNRIRLAGFGSKIENQGSEIQNFNHWFDLDFKFMNFANRSILEGEKVVHAILQPEIRTSRLTILGNRFSRRVSPTVASILTDRELIMIREEEKQAARERYGGIWTYVPLAKIAKLSLSPKDGSLLVFSIQLLSGDHLEYLFQTSAKREIDQLLERFGELTAT
jgi:hypothetical protein